MNIKTLLLILSLMSLLVGGVLAHDADDDSHFRHAAMRWSHNGIGIDLVSATLLDATGLDAPQLYDALMDGSALAELIAANDGDVDATRAALSEQISQQIQSASDSAIERLDERIAETLQQSRVDKRRWRRFRPIPRMPFGSDMNSVILDATGLDESGLRAALWDGSSIAQLIEANDGDVAEVTASLTAQATEQISERTAARLERVGEFVDEALQRDFSEVFERMRQFRMGRRGFFNPWGGMDMDGKHAESAEAAEA